MNIISDIIRKFTRLKTWQKIGIAIGLLSIFKYFTMGSIIMQVKAETCEPYVTNPNTGLPEKVELTKSENETYYTNLDPADLTFSNNKLNWSYYYYTYGYTTDSNDVITGAGDDVYLASVGANLDFRSKYVSSITITDSNYNGTMGKIRPNTDYTLVIEVIAGTGVNISNIDAYKSSDFGVSMQGRYMQYNYNENVNLNSYYKLKNVRWTTCIDNEGQVANDRGYLIIKFKTNELLPQPSNGLYIKNITVSVLNMTDNGIPLYNIGDTIDSNYKYLIRQNNNSGGIVNVKRVGLIMDGDVEVGSDDAKVITGESFKNTKYEDCSVYNPLTQPIDRISCEVRNVRTGIESITRNLIYNLMQMVAYIFVPDFDFINQNINDIKDTLASKWPDFQAMFDYFDYCISRLQQVTTTTVIQFDGFAWPFSNDQTYIIPPFTYDFGTIINDPRIYPYYLMGRIVTTIGILILWTIWLMHFAMNLLHNNSSIV